MPVIRSTYLSFLADAFGNQRLISIVYLYFTFCQQSVNPSHGHQAGGPTDNQFPLHVSLDERTATTGVVLCEHIRALDLNSRPCVFVEKIPDDILRKVADIISAEIEIPVSEESAENTSE